MASNYGHLVLVAHNLARHIFGVAASNNRIMFGEFRIGISAYSLKNGAKN